MTKRKRGLLYLAVVSIAISACNGYNASHALSLSYSIRNALEVFGLCMLVVCVFLLTERMKDNSKHSDNFEKIAAISDGIWTASVMTWGYFFSWIAYPIGSVEPKPISLSPYVWIAFAIVIAVTVASYLIREKQIDMERIR